MGVVVRHMITHIPQQALEGRREALALKCIHRLRAVTMRILWEPGELLGLLGPIRRSIR